MMETTKEMLFYYLKVNGGSIVSSNDLNPFEITQAAASNRMYVDEDGFGFIWMPSFKDRMPTTPDEVEMFETCYPLPADLPIGLKTFTKPDSSTTVSVGKKLKEDGVDDITDAAFCQCNVIRRLPTVEEVKRWNQILVGLGEEQMMKDIKATFV